MDELVQELAQALAAVQTALNAAQAQQQPQQPTEDPAWTAVQEALTTNGWSFNKTTTVPVTDGDAPSDSQPAE